MSTPDPSSYASSLSFLLSQVGAHSAQLFAARLEPLGVTPRAYGLLGALAREGGRTQQRLADELGIHRNSMVSLVDQLESRGWARRQRSQRDRRAFDIHLTPAGLHIVHRVELLVQELDTQLSAGLGPAERADMITLLTTIATRSGLPPGVHPNLRSTAIEDGP